MRRIFHQSDPISYALIWLGVSIGMHAFPSKDARVLWREAREAARELNPLAMISLPLVVVIYLADFGSVFWLDYLYGAALGLGLPELLLQQMA